MPEEIGDIGFPIVLHPRDPDTAWVFPMDGTTVWPRTSPRGKAAAYVTQDAGRSWSRQDRGLPREQAWFTVKRQAFCADECDSVGRYLGTTGGEIWMSLQHLRNIEDLPIVHPKVPHHVIHRLQSRHVIALDVHRRRQLLLGQARKNRRLVQGDAQSRQQLAPPGRRFSRQTRPPDCAGPRAG